MSQPQYQGPPPGYEPQNYNPQYGVQPQQGYPPPQGYQPQQTHTSNVVVVSQPGAVMRGGCARCGGGAIVDSYTCCGICLAIWFFPIGILCCLAMTEKKCANCGALY